MAWKMPQSRGGPSVRRLHEAKMEEIKLQADLQRRNQEAQTKAEEVPWYEKWALKPLVDVGTAALGGALGDAISPATRAATAMRKQQTGGLAESAMSGKFADYMQAWMRKKPGRKRADWTFGAYKGELSPDLRAWAEKNEPSGR